MGSGRGLSRRTLLHSCLGWLCMPLQPAAARGSRAEDCLQTMLDGFSRTSVIKKRYRVDASVLLCGVPLFTKQGVGGAYASVEIGTGVDSRAVALQFAAGSWPERAKGLNRFGILREVVNDRNEEPLGFAFAGLIAYSPEHSLEQGRRVLSGGSRTDVNVLLAMGEGKDGVMEAWSEVVQLPSGCAWTELTQFSSTLLRRNQLAALSRNALGARAPFLYAMHRGGREMRPECGQNFVHSRKCYSLETRCNPSRPLELFGEIRTSAGVKCSEFRATYRAGDDSGIPSRIEYHPRPFLRLTFELDASAAHPPIPSVFPGENI